MAEQVSKWISVFLKATLRATKMNPVVKKEKVGDNRAPKK